MKGIAYFFILFSPFLDLSYGPIWVEKMDTNNLTISRDPFIPWHHLLSEIWKHLRALMPRMEQHKIPTLFTFHSIVYIKRAKMSNDLGLDQLMKIPIMMGKQSGVGFNELNPDAYRFIRLWME
jgi:hypothetical protein